jgi:hypothetical protein
MVAAADGGIDSLAKFAGNLKKPPGKAVGGFFHEGHVEA